jgi:hypothetical protein
MRPLLKSALVAVLLAGTAAATISTASAHEYDGYGYGDGYHDSYYHHRDYRDHDRSDRDWYHHRDYGRWHDRDGWNGRNHWHHDRDRWDY